MLAVPSSASAATIANGGFEAGAFTGWTKSTQGLATGTSTPGPRCHPAGPSRPRHRGRRRPRPTSPGPGSHVLYQDVALEASARHTLTFKLYYRSSASLVSPEQLEHTGSANQQYRVDVMGPAAPIPAPSPPPTCWPPPSRRTPATRPRSHRRRSPSTSRPSPGRPSGCASPRLTTRTLHRERRRRRDRHGPHRQRGARDDDHRGAGRRRDDEHEHPGVRVRLGRVRLELRVLRRRRRSLGVHLTVHRHHARRRRTPSRSRPPTGPAARIRRRPLGASP